MGKDTEETSPDIEYIPVKQLAADWKLSVRRVQMMCMKGLLEGAVKKEGVWLVPSNVVRPKDNRMVTGEYKRKRRRSRRRAAGLKDDENAIIISAMSHNVRNSLNAIFGYSDLLQKYAGDEERVKEYVRGIHNSGQDILNLVSNIVDLTSVKRGEIILRCSTCDLEALLQGIITNYTDMARKKNILVLKRCRLAHKFFFIDEKIIERIIGNVVKNAIQYSRQGGLVMIRAEELENRDSSQYATVRYLIEDYGIGMSEEFLGHVFDDFSMENPDDVNERKGNGLGMPIVKGLTELLDGSIAIASRVDYGTKVEIILRHRIPNENDDEETRDMYNDMENLRGRRVLLAEDSIMNQEIAKEILLNSGLQVECADDGIACVEAITNNTAGYFDLVLMDIAMPNMDGIAATKMIRGLKKKRLAQIPIIAMTASVLKEDRDAATDAGMDAFIEKPLNMKELFSVMKSVIK